MRQCIHVLHAAPDAEHSQLMLYHPLKTSHMTGSQPMKIAKLSKVHVFMNTGTAVNLKNSPYINNKRTILAILNKNKLELCFLKIIAPNLYEDFFNFRNEHNFSRTFPLEQVL